MNSSIFKCPKCGGAVEGFVPGRCTNGHTIQVMDGVYQFTEDLAISTQDDGLKWLGYEKVGVNYEPGHALHSKDGNFGMFGACSRKLAGLLNKDEVVLDLGAGLGQASIPLAITGVKTIAADISQSMLKAMVERAETYGVLNNNLICTRMNAYNLKLLDSSIDAVIEIDMIHQVDRPDLVMDEIKRVLKPDGIYAKYGCKGLPLTEEQMESNARGYQIESDIRSYYRTIIEESGYGTRPFSCEEVAKQCMEDNFELLQTIDTEEVSDWVGDVNFKLHRIKTRASGGDQLIPDDIHNDAWTKTEQYAVQKYGEGYGEIKRYGRITGILSVYKRKSQITGD